MSWAIRGKAVVNCHVSSVEMNESEPFDEVSKCKPDAVKTELWAIVRNKSWCELETGKGGSRRKGGMTSVQALVRNLRTCRYDVKGDAEVETS